MLSLLGTGPKPSELKHITKQQLLATPVLTLDDDDSSSLNDNKCK